MKRRTAILSCAAIAVGPWRLQAQSPAGNSLRERVADAERAFAGAMARRDQAAFATHIAEDAIFLGDGADPTALRGRRAIVAGWESFFSGPTAPFSWAPDLVEVLESGTLAFSSGPVRDPKGTVVGRFNSIWRLDGDGRWRVVFDRGCPVCRE